MRRYLLHVLIISFAFPITSINYAEEPRITLRSSYSDLSVSQVQSMPNITIRKKAMWGFYGHSTINHSYKKLSINGDMVVTDNTTGLMWHQSGSDENMEWNKAKDWIRSLNRRRYAGYNNWRLPTLEEASSLLESSKNENLYIDHVFSKKQWWIWTGDKKDDSKAAWLVYFYLGNVLYHSFGYRNLYVRPVRSLNIKPKPDMSPSRGWLGVAIQNMDSSLAEQFGVSAAEGVFIFDVQNDSPASEAGFERGDILIGYDNKEVNDFPRLRNLVAQTEVGETVNVKVLRKGKEKVLTVIIGEQPSD